MHYLTSEAQIDASPERVYDVLTDLERYSEWNPWIIAVRGDGRVGGPPVEAEVKLGNKTMTVGHRILVAAPPQVFQWCDVGWFTHFVYGQRTRYVRARPDGGVDYHVELLLAGSLVWLVRVLYERHLRAGMDAETAALKARAESV